MRNAELCRHGRAGRELYQPEREHLRETVPNLSLRIVRVRDVSKIVTSALEAAQANVVQRELPATASCPLSGDQYVHVGVLPVADPIHPGDLASEVTEVAEESLAVHKHQERPLLRLLRFLGGPGSPQRSGQECAHP